MIFISHSGVAYNNNPPGRGSGRYPFGSGDRPFQRSGIRALVQKHKSKKKKKQQIKNLEKARVAREEKAKRKKEIEDAVKSGDLEKVKKYRSEMTAQQIEEALNNVNWQKKLNEAISKSNHESKKSSKKQLDDIMNNVKTFNSYYQTLLSIYDNVDKTVKILNKPKEQAKKTALDNLIRSADLDKIIANRSKLSGNQLEEANKYYDNLQNILKKQAASKK